MTDDQLGKIAGKDRGMMSLGDREPYPECARDVADAARVYDASEQDAIIAEFTRMLREVTKDGGRKRAAGLKPSWTVDTSHRVAIFSHLLKWQRGEKEDVDSGVHPLVHLAWRALAVAWQETHDA